MLSSSFGAWKALFIHKNGVKLFAELWKSHASWRHFGDGFKEVPGQKLAKKGAPDGANCMSPCTSFWPCPKLRVHLPSPCSCPPLNVSACFDANSRAVNNLLLLQMLFRLSAALSLSLFFLRPGKSVPFPFPLRFPFPPWLPFNFPFSVGHKHCPRCTYLWETETQTQAVLFSLSRWYPVIWNQVYNLFIAFWYNTWAALIARMQILYSKVLNSIFLIIKANSKWTCNL